MAAFEATSAGPSSTTAKLGYLVPPEEGVRAYYHIDADPITGAMDTNIKQGEREVVIENLRGKEDTVSLDVTGFQFVHHPVRHKSFTNNEDIVREYYPENAELLKKLTGASRVEIFDHSTSSST